MHTSAFPKQPSHSNQVLYHTASSQSTRLRDCDMQVAQKKKIGYEDALNGIKHAKISIAANLPQKEIGKYIKILGEALQLSQPLNNNSIVVHMPRSCTLLQLNKSAQDTIDILQGHYVVSVSRDMVPKKP